MAATGLPLPKVGEVVNQPIQVIDGDRLSAARSWASIAATGAELAKVGYDDLKYQMHQIQVGEYSRMDVEDTRKITELRDKNHHDPEGFDRDANAYRDGVLANTPAWAINHRRAKLGSLSNSSYAGILGEKRTQDLRLAKDNWTADVDMASREVSAAAMTGPMDSPAGLVAMENYRNKIAAGVTSSFISQREAERLILNTADSSIAQGVVRETKEIYTSARANQESGYLAALKHAEENILRNPRFKGLTEQERYAYYSRATSEVRALEAERKQDLGLARQAKVGMEFAMNSGLLPEPSALDSLVKQLNGAGGHAEAAALLANYERQKVLMPFGQQPLSQMLRQRQDYGVSSGATAPPQVRGFVDEAAGATGVPASYLYRTLGRESRFNPYAQSPTSTAGGMGQFIDSTWNEMISKHGAKYGLAPGTPKTDPRASILMTAEYAKENAARLEASGLPVNDQTLYVMHFAGPGGTLLLRADPSSQASTLLPKAAAANRTIFYNKDGSPRTVGEVVAQLGSQHGGGGAAGGGFVPRPTYAPGVDPRLAVGMNKQIATKAWEEWKLLDAQFKPDGSRPSQQHVELVQMAAAESGDHRLLQTIADKLGQYQVATELGQQPVGQQQAVHTELGRRAAAGELTPNEDKVLQTLDQKIALTTKNIVNDENPIDHTVKAWSNRGTFQTPPPLNPGKDGFREALAYRAQIAQFARESYQTGPLSALDKPDVAAINAFLGSTADPRLKARMFSDLVAAIPDEQMRNKTLAKLGQESPEAMVSAFAGGMYSVNPDLAASILRGQGIIKVDPRKDPAAKDQAGGKTEYADALDKVMPQDAFAVEMRSTLSGAYATMRSATTARYADLTPPGETKFSEARLQQAANEVTGGFVKHNGGSILAPERGMTQARFDGVMWALTDDDLRGAMTLSGTPLTVDYLRSSASLESRSDGTYYVRMNSNAMSPEYAMVAVGEFAAPSNFVLDLRGRKPGAANVLYSEVPFYTP
jgi:hypothetical protein